MFENILVPTDGSEHAAKAVDVAADLAQKYGAKVHLLHVVRDLGSSMIPPDLLSIARVERVEMTERAVVESVANQILRSAALRTRERGAKQVDTALEVGAPAERILAIAKSLKADAIVMGTRGLGDIRGLLMGSTAHKVNHLAGCTCITVH